VERLDMAEHEKSDCKGQHRCGKCHLPVLKHEVQAHSHDCFETLQLYLKHLLTHKDNLIESLRFELSRKNALITKLLKKQEKLEDKMNTVDDILKWDRTEKYKPGMFSSHKGEDSSMNISQIIDQSLMSMEGEAETALLS
jgi:hypothetical protein